MPNIRHQILARIANNSLFFSGSVLNLLNLASIGANQFDHQFGASN